MIPRCVLLLISLMRHRRAWFAYNCTCTQPDFGADRFPQLFAKAVSSPDRDSHKRIGLPVLIIREKLEQKQKTTKHNTE